MTPVWRLLWIFFLSLAWLLPHHYKPWSTFHSDAWLAAVSLMGALAVLLRVRAPLQWPTLACWVAPLVLLPWLQWLGGLLPWSGQAWISSVYLLGFLLALLAGRHWESACPGQLPQALLGAIVLAAVMSVGLQLGTWQQVIPNGPTDILSMGLSGNRPYANLGQPNLLATLLLWGLLGGLWAYVSGSLGHFSAALLAAFLLVGLAMTGSRMGWLALTALLAALWLWRGLWANSLLPWAATALYGWFLLCPVLLRRIDELSGAGTAGDTWGPRDLAGDIRLKAWRVFLEAVLERPWLGYGWTDLGVAQLAVAGRFESLGMRFGHAHNLVLDLVLWTGLPLGLLLTAVLAVWCWRKLRAVRQAQDAVLLLFVGIVGGHAMLELPLHHALFLLPTGLVMGVLDARMGLSPALTTPRWSLGLIALAAALALGATTRDYLRIEASYNALRLEQARIGLSTTPPWQAPEPWVLNAHAEWLRVARLELGTGMSRENLEAMENMTLIFPSPATLYRMATALALNQRPEDALGYVRKACQISEIATCQAILLTWGEVQPGDFAPEK